MVHTYLYPIVVYFYADKWFIDHSIGCEGAKKDQFVLYIQPNWVNSQGEQTCTALSNM